MHPPFPEQSRAEVIVVGGGLAGLTAAVALSSAGLRTALIAPPSRPDGRTSALLSGSVTALEALGVWPRCQSDAAALTAIRIVDDRQSLFPAPEVAFHAADLGLEAFGYNLPNERLRAALEGRAAEIPTLMRFEDTVADLVLGREKAVAVLASGRKIGAPLVVAADGSRSLCRTASGIVAETSDYPQTALTCSLQHTRPHRSESTEFHTSEGPFTLVPLPGSRSSLVWVMAPRRAEALARMGEAELARAVERQSRSILGEVIVEEARQTFPLARMRVARLGQNRVALVGEAAHVIPPIGAQGFNLGLRDAAAIAELVVDAHRERRDIGGDDLLQRYDARRRTDIATRTAVVDILNRSLLTSFLPVDAVRGLGLYLLDRLDPVRRAVMQAGLGPRGDESRLMRGQPL